MNNTDVDDLKFILAVARRRTHTTLLRLLDKAGDVADGGTAPPGDAAAVAAAADVPRDRGR